MKQTAVIGAGLVGSLWALYLARRGYEVNVFERRPDMRKADTGGGRSINLALSDRGLKALDDVGLTDEVKKMAIPMKGRFIHHLDGSTELQPYGDEGQYINSISRSGLNMLLMDKAEEHPKVNFRFNTPCQGLDTESYQALLGDEERPFSTQCEVLFGTDGAFSAVRSNMMKMGRFNYQQQYLEHGYKELTIPPAEDGGFRMEKNALHIWPRKNFMLIALPNLDGSFTVTLFLAFEGEYSFDKLNSGQAVQEFFNTHFPDAVPLMPTLVDDFFTNPTSALVTIRCYPWTAGDNVLLLGDASHAIVPFYGQGMNAGFEDCYLLNQLADEHREDWPAIIHDFEQKRKPDADAIAELALRNFIEMRDLVVDEQFLLRKRIEKAIHEKHPKEFQSLYSMVTFSDMPYAKALSLGDQYKAFFAAKENLHEVSAKLHTEEGQAILEDWFQELKQLQA